MFEVGQVYSRRDDIHAKFGGQEQGGISTPKGCPYIFLFSSDRGKEFGYFDGWTPEHIYRYVGEGQAGDMTLTRGNWAVANHASIGKTLALFGSLGKGRGVRFIGEFACCSWENQVGQDRDHQIRKLIVFHLVPINSVAPPSGKSPGDTQDDLRSAAYSALKPAGCVDLKESRRLLYVRSAAIREYVLSRALGRCESCHKEAPFKRPDGSPYLEPHHTRRVSDGGPDHPRWIGAVCPNCHREIHYGRDGKAKNTELEVYLASVEPEDHEGTAEATQPDKEDL